MKKLFTFLMATLMSVCLFGQTPTQVDLQSFMEDGYYVACFQAPIGSTCNDIYWEGEYCGWNISTDLDNLVKCEPLTGFAGWYVAKVPAGNGVNGKPIQLNECGQMTWDVQPGTAAATELVAGEVNIKPNGSEYDLEGWSTTEPTIIKIGSWKNGYNPCEMTCAAQSYTIRIYPPYCEYLEELEPTIKGSFNQWGDAITMEFKGSYFEYVSDPVTAGFEFKFNNDAAGSWEHEFQHYDAENDNWTNVPASGNFSLTNGTEFYEYDEANRILTFDFSDDALFRYNGCEEQGDPEMVVFGVKLPAGAPAAGVELVGSWGGDDTWNTGIILEPGAEAGWYITYAFYGEEATLIMPSHVFKIREVGTWDNQLSIKDATTGLWKDMDNTKFGSVWTDDTWKGVPVKMIELDLSGENYGWSAITQSIENVVLTEKAQKVVVNGVLYIVRDNKMFNVQGTQVR